MNKLQLVRRMASATLTSLKTRALGKFAKTTANHGLVAKQSEKTLVRLKQEFNELAQQPHLITDGQLNPHDAFELTGGINASINSSWADDVVRSKKLISKLDKKTMDSLLHPFLADTRLTWNTCSPQDYHLVENALDIYASTGTYKDIKYIQKYLTMPQYKDQATKAIDSIVERAKAMPSRAKGEQWLYEHGGVDEVAASWAKLKEFNTLFPNWFA